MRWLLIALTAAVASLVAVATTRSLSAAGATEPPKVANPVPAASAAPLAATPVQPHQPAACRPWMRGRTIVVSIHRQHLWACRHGQQVQSTEVTTGAVDRDRGDRTPTGHWRIQRKQRDTWLVGATWSDRVNYWMPYDGTIGFHDAPWQRFPMGSAKYRLHGSHGCVHVPTHQMARLFHWARPGTRVIVRA